MKPHIHEAVTKFEEADSGLNLFKEKGAREGRRDLKVERFI